MTILIHPQSVDKLAINLSDEPDEEQSQEQLDVINQVAASLSDEQRDSFIGTLEHLPTVAHVVLARRGKGLTP